MQELKERERERERRKEAFHGGKLQTFLRSLNLVEISEALILILSEIVGI